MLSQAAILRNNSRSVLPSPPIVAVSPKISLWYSFTRWATWFIPDDIVKKFTGPNTAKMQAWREKTTLCRIIAWLCFCLGCLTYGVNMLLCKGENQMVLGKLKKDHFKQGTILGNGGIYYSDVDFGFGSNTASPAKKPFRNN